MSDLDLVRWRLVFIAAAGWNLAGGLPGYLLPQEMFQHLFGVAISDPLMLSIYRGAWGTALLYFFGYLIVAYNPKKHTGIVMLGALGKFFFIWNLLGLYLAGKTTDFALVVIAGDSLFLGRLVVRRSALF